MPKELPSLSYLHKVLRYEPDTGLFFWREKDDKPALLPTASGSKARVYLQGCACYVGHIAWALTHDEWPSDYLPRRVLAYKNLDVSDNRLINLEVIPHGDVIRRNSGKNSPFNQMIQRMSYGVYA